MKNKLLLTDILHDFKHTYLTEKLLFYMGFFGPMPLIEVGGLTFFTILILLVIAAGLLGKKGRTLTGDKNSCTYFVITVFSIISAFKCLIWNMPETWKSGQVKNIIWYSVYMLVYFLFANRHQYKKIRMYFYGIYLSSIVQLIWGYLQLLIYTTMGKYLNDIIFIDMLHVSRDFATQFKGNSIALSGMCWNAANMAPLMAFLYCFTANPYLKIAVIGLSILSLSRTVLIGIVVCILGEVIIWIRSRKIARKTMNRIAIFLPAIILFVIVISYSYPNIFTSLGVKINSFLLSFSFKNMQQEGSASVHVRYITSVFDLIRKCGVINTLFGYGLGCSGYPFALFYNQWGGVLGGAWSTECDYTNFLWGTGLIAFLIRYVWYIRNCIKARRINVGCFIFLISYFVQAITYNVSFNWNLILLIFLFEYIYRGEDFCFREKAKNTS